MQLDLTPEQDGYLRRAIGDGRLENAEEAFRDALDFAMGKETFDEKIEHAFRLIRETKDKADIRKLIDLFILAVGAYQLATTDDPFRSFDEWNSDADRVAYADL